MGKEHIHTYLCLLIRIIIFDMKRQSKGILIFAMTFYFSIGEHEADAFNDSIALLLPSVSVCALVMHENIRDVVGKLYNYKER